MNGKKLLTLALVLIFFLLLSSLGYVQYLLKPIQQKAVDFVIQENQSIREVASELQNKGIIRNATAFILYLRALKLDTDIKAGDYHLEPVQSIQQLINALQKGQEKLIKYTIPEDYRIQKIAQKLAKEGLVNETRFLDLASKKGGSFPFIYADQIKDGNLEGFLFPNTYLISQPTEEKIIEQMLGEFEKEVTATVLQNISKTKLTLRQIITLASVIEKEAQVKAEQPIIASVFYNRMAIDMPLQSCATVEFALYQKGIFKDSYVLSLEELKTDSPYNTYMFPGLPPGPICNPGIDAILAAINPAKTDYYYFAAKGDGSHAFGRTLEEHNNNVEKYIP
jgi:UPF0755 protein